MVNRTIAVLIVVIIIFGLVIVALSYPYLSRTLSNVQKTTGTLPKSTSVSSPFTVTLTPSSQTVVNELSQEAAFDVTITGTVSNPVAISIYTGASSPYTGNEMVDTYNSASMTVEPIIQGNSITYPIVVVLYAYANSGTYHAHATVIDSQGNSESSNSVSVTVK
jgi:hypothetical protein